MNIVEIHANAVVARWPATLLLLSLLTALPAPSRADDQTRAEQPACGTQRTDPAVAHPESLVKALYDIVSGPANSARDWARLERLQIRPVVALHDAGLRPKKLVCADVIRLYQGKVDEIDQRIAELTEVRDRARRRLNVLVEQRNQGGPAEA